MKIVSIFLSILLIACSTESNQINDPTTTTSLVLDYEKGLGSEPSDFVSNWNKIVEQVSSNNATINFFSINPDKVKWVDSKKETLLYQFDKQDGGATGFTLNINVDTSTNKIYGIEFFSPASTDSVIAEQTKFFFLLLIAISDPELSKDAREKVLSNLGLYENVENPRLMSSSLTKNNITYQIEPLVDNDLLIGLTLLINDNNFLIAN